MRKYLLYSSILLICINCDKRDPQYIIINNEEINLSSWEKMYDFEEYDYRSIKYRKKNEDTLFYLSVGEVPKDNYFTYKYSKTFEDSEYIFTLIGNEDTLCYYKKSKKFPDSLFFFRGKYFYDYDKWNLTLGQSLYFENNIDSLVNIRGNNLPDLPEDSSAYLDTIPSSEPIF